MKKIILVIALSMIGLLAACGNVDQTDDLVDIREHDAVSLLNGLKNDDVVAKDYAVSVFPNEVKVTSDDEELVLLIEEDIFFLSVAPYIHNTHECFYHSATGRRGELIDQEFTVLIIDQNGDVVFDQVMNSGTNGFIDLWLPRGIEGTLTIEYDGLSVVQDVSTIGDAKTCETTMRLQ